MSAWFDTIASQSLTTSGQRRKIYMHRENLLHQLNAYRSSPLATPQEFLMISNFQTFIQTNPHCFDRANTGHITSSIWIINHAKTHALLTHHKKFNLWVQLGGHNDGQIDCKQVAAQEALEESGIPGLQFLYEGIFDIDVHAIPSPCTFHYDIRYLMQAPPDTPFAVSEESHDLAWVPFESITDYTLHSSVLRMNEKCIRFLKGEYGTQKILEQTSQSNIQCDGS